MAIEIREAVDEATRERVYRFRYAVHVVELGKDGPGIDHDREMLRDEADEGSTIFYAEEEGRIVGTARVTAGRDGPFAPFLREWFDTEPLERQVGRERLTVTGRLMVDPAFRGRTLASLLVMHLYDFGLRIGTDFNFCLTEPGLLRLYYRLGYRQYRAPVRPAGPGMRLPLVLCLRDRRHLLRVQSPFAMLLPADRDDQGRSATTLAALYPAFVAESPCLEGDLRTLWARLADELTRRAGRRTLLDGLDDAQIERVFALAAEVTFGSGEVIRHRRESRRGLGVVLSGRLGVGLPTHDGWHWVEILGPGDVFGENEAPPAEGRAADLVALEPTRTALLSENLITRIARTEPELALRLTNNLAAVLAQRVDDLHRRSVAWAVQDRERLTREHTIPPLRELAG